MYLIIENTQKTFPFPEQKTLLVGNDFDCDVQINHPKIWGRHFAITEHSYGCVLEVFDEPVKVNGQVVKEKSMLDAGDQIEIDELTFLLVDDQYIPKDSNVNHTNVNIEQDKSISSVFGLRNFSQPQAGQFIIDNYHHQDGWHVFRQDNELHFIDNKNKTLLNGLKIAQAKLSNGDVIVNKNYKFKVELPGTSGFSKFSPSHPRNVQLSESFGQPETKQSKDSPATTNFFKNNLWWLTILVGLVILLLVVMNNPNF